MAKRTGESAMVWPFANTTTWDLDAVQGFNFTFRQMVWVGVSGVEDIDDQHCIRPPFKSRLIQVFTRRMCPSVLTSRRTVRQTTASSLPGPLVSMLSQSQRTPHYPRGDLTLRTPQAAMHMETLKRFLTEYHW